MGYYFIPILFAAISVFAAVAIYLYRKTNITSNIICTDFSTKTESKALTPKQVRSGEISLSPIELLPARTHFEDKKLFEITDKNVIARISQTIPAATQAAASTAVQRIAKETLSNPNVYSLKIPSGNSLVGKTKNGIQYAMHKGSGGRGHSQLEKVDYSKMTKATALANNLANVINLGSLIVGQYYMSVISVKLQALEKSIAHIGNFQDREFKSRILSVVTLVGEISEFSSEIMENDEQRNLKIAAVENLKASATELLGQLNISISEITEATPNIDYRGYQIKVCDLHKLVQYQGALVAVLEEISRLTYLLGKGSISIERSYSAYNKYLSSSVQTRDCLKEWHGRQVKTLRIDLESGRISKSGVEAIISVVPGLFDEKHKYNELNPALVGIINTQAEASFESAVESKRIYDDDVEIIIKDGKYFYLLESPAEEEEV